MKKTRRILPVVLFLTALPLHMLEAKEPGMALVRAGGFTMGDSYYEGSADERPKHRVFVSAFYMDKFVVSNEKMRQVLQWAHDRGLIEATAGGVTNNEGSAQELLDLDDPDCQINFSGGTFGVDSGKTNFPCGEVSWYGAQAYCNYSSDMEGLSRCIDLSDWSCDFNQNGYRLPTEAEWEKAARGGLATNHYPWPSRGGVFGDHISGSNANFIGSDDSFEGQVGPGPDTCPVGYYDGDQAPEGSDMTNGYGLYDMAGNVWEWCWDLYQDDWYSGENAKLKDTKGPVATGVFRVLRGGCWHSRPISCRVANRHSDLPDSTEYHLFGFRTVRTAFPER